MKIKKYFQEYKNVIKAYEICFFGNNSVSDTNRLLPLVFRIEEKFDRAWFGESRYLEIAHPLDESQLTYANYVDASEAFSKSPLKSDTFYVIGHAMEYVSQRERDISRRDALFKPFKSIQTPRYCIIVFISDRLKSLCSRTDWGTLIHEYEALINFVQNIIDNADKYFKTRKGSNTGFHYFLSETITRIENLKKISTYYLQRTSIATHLESIANTTESYRNTLVECLAFILSESKLGAAVHPDYFTGDGRLLPQDFKTTKIYESLKSALLGETVFIDLKQSNTGISSLVLKLEEREKIIKAYNKLLMALSILNQFKSIFLAIAECAKIEGESQCVHDKKLNLLLNTSLKALDGLFSSIHQQINFLLGQNALAMVGHENFQPGFTTNFQSAKKKTKELEREMSSISDGETLIQQRLKRIEHLDPEMRDAMKTQEVLRVQHLISGLKEQELIEHPLADELLHSIDEQCSSAEGKGGKMLQENDHDENAISNRLRVKFPTVYEALGQREDALKQFELLVVQYEQEIRDFFELLKKINQAIEIIQRIMLSLSRVASISPSSLSEDDFIGLDQDYLLLKQCIASIEYKNVLLENFGDIDKLFDLFKKEESEYLASIKRILMGNETFSREDNEGKQFRIKVFVPVKVQFESMKQPLCGSTEQLKVRLSKDTHLTQSSHYSILEYYQRLISDHKRNVVKKSPEKTQSDKSFSQVMQICNNLIDEELKDKRSEQLKSLFDFLCDFEYTLKYRGGTTVIINDVKKKFPANVAAILNYYLANIELINSNQQLDMVRDNIFLIAHEAYENEKIYCCGLFKITPRAQTTKSIYQALSFAKRTLDDSLLQASTIPNV